MKETKIKEHNRTEQNRIEHIITEKKRKGNKRK